MFWSRLSCFVAAIIGLLGLVAIVDAQAALRPPCIERAPYETPPPAPNLASSSGHSSRAQRLIAEVSYLSESTRRIEASHAYTHTTRVDLREQVFHWDCSAMLTWLLRRIHGPLPSGSRPVARDIANMIERGRGVHPVARLVDIQPGDIFAWRRPRGFPSRMSGHCGVVLSQARQVSGFPNLWAVRIADATSLPHQDDTRGNGASGYGEGTIVFGADAEGHGRSYGWAGTLSGGYVVTPIIFGRLR